MENISVDFNGKANEKLSNALKHAASIDKNDIEHGDPESFDFMKELRTYKEKHGLGGDAHDLSKWSRAQRAAYSYGRFDPFDGFCF